MIKAFVFDAYGTLFDVQSVTRVIEAAFPGHGDYVTQVWRLKQLEYSWLRSLGGCYADFWQVTTEALTFTLKTIGLKPDQDLFRTIADAYNELSAYPDAEEALKSLSGYRLAILSNGSPAMLDALVGASTLGRYLEATLSVDGSRAYKPDPRTYALVVEALEVARHEVVFVSSNGFDAAGAKAFGFRVARIERVSSAALERKLADPAIIGPRLMFDALRSQRETYGPAPDFTIGSLRELAGVVAAAKFSDF